MIDVNLVNFEAEVINASFRVPVLLDIWAEWCGPCKQLGPRLEQLETEQGGRFVLAKLDADKTPEIAGQLSEMFGVRSIPFCVLFKDGQPVDGFVGALPPEQLRTFLAKHLPAAEQQAEVEEEAEVRLDAEPAQAADGRSVQEQMADALAQNPGNDDLRFDYVKRLISHGQLAEAAAALAPAMGQIPLQLRFEALQQWLNALEFVSNDPRGQWRLEQFDEAIAANKRDFDSRFAKSRLLIAQDDWQAAMEELLEIIMRDKKWADEAPRKTYVALLELLTPPKPKADPGAAGKGAGGIEIAAPVVQQQDPQAELVARYRRKLSMALN
ncbi:tetratricopeptide repeat protein [Malikia sp.]|uniref:tetratricopeptide repeat protein n=1 Tax=Malikia sp. TaxID=2070706 RepID=UPI0026241EBD|nr:tetratricopeptide repeat protein [Malikia sp.]MDD2729600.1 tetratricopeptide repeat protein [Malikia sp.]